MSVGSKLRKYGLAIIAGAISGVLIDTFRHVTVNLAAGTTYGWVSVLLFELFVLVISLSDLMESLVLFLVFGIVSLILPFDLQVLLGGGLLILGSFLKELSL